jgi:hypothetical protein
MGRLVFDISRARSRAGGSFGIGAALLLGAAILAVPAPCRAGPKSVTLLPDPSCASSSLNTFVQDGLSRLGGERLRVVKPEPGKSGGIQIQYLFLVREDRGSVTVQIDGRAFEPRSEKLLADGSAISESFPADDAGRQSAARQAGERLAELLRASLEKALEERGKGRKVLVQASFAEEAASSRDPVIAGLQGSLPRARLKGSTERSVTILLVTDESARALAKSVEQILSRLGALQAEWVVQSDTNLVFRVRRKSP